MRHASEIDDPIATALDPANVLPRRIEHWYEHSPERPFLVEADGGRAETYGSFRCLVRRWARVLADSGVSAGDRVVSLLPSSIDAHAAWLAASLLGAFEVPIDPALRGEFLRHVLTDSGATVCIARPGQVAILDGSGVNGLRPLVAPADGSLTNDLVALDVERLPDPDDVSCVIYTSGTTGPAKGVVIRWAPMCLPARWASCGSGHRTDA